MDNRSAGHRADQWKNHTESAGEAQPVTLRKVAARDTFQFINCHYSSSSAGLKRSRGQQKEGRGRTQPGEYELFERDVPCHLSELNETNNDNIFISRRPVAAVDDPRSHPSLPYVSYVYPFYPPKLSTSTPSFIIIPSPHDLALCPFICPSQRPRTSHFVPLFLSFHTRNWI